MASVATFGAAFELRVETFANGGKLINGHWPLAFKCHQLLTINKCKIVSQLTATKTLIFRLS